MTDERLAELFAEGTASESDAAFARRVHAQVGRTRFGRRLVLPMRPPALLTLVSAVFMAVRLIEPALARIGENSPQRMGVV